jgi:hypothetical protein
MAFSRRRVLHGAKRFIDVLLPAVVPLLSDSTGEAVELFSSREQAEPIVQA